MGGAYTGDCCSFRDMNQHTSPVALEKIMPVSWKKIVTKQTLLEPLVWTLNKKIRNYYPFGELKK